MPISVPVATSDEPLPGPTEDQAAATERSPAARLARVHLRGGLLTLARATLEGMAGAGTLDTGAMADLAEAWIYETPDGHVPESSVAMLERALDIEPDRVFIDFTDLPRTRFAWNGKTFG